VLLGLPEITDELVELAETKMAVRNERAHLQRIGKRESLPI
jgi:hypothetical protein